jgi:hypothetical protein
LSPTASLPLNTATDCIGWSKGVCGVMGALLRHAPPATGINYKGSCMTRNVEVILVGGGIRCLATALRILEARPGTRLVLIEKEPDLA